MLVALDTITLASPNPEALAAIFGTVLGWQQVAQGPVSSELERHWAIAESSAGKSFSVWQAGDIARGRVRLIYGAERKRTRPIAHRWAGIEMIVSHDIDALYAQIARDTQLTTLQEPVTMDWSEFGSNQHRAFILRGPGGTHLSFTMGLTQPVGRDFPRTQAWAGHVFELPLVTASFARLRRFYAETLHMSAFLESSFDRGLWHRIWRLPEPTPVQLHILKGSAPGTGLGGIELTGYPSNMIDPGSATRDRFDGGTCLVSYTTRDIDAVYTAVSRDRDAHLLSAPSAIAARGYDGRRAFCCLGPDGERLEFISAS